KLLEDSAKSSDPKVSSIKKVWVEVGALLGIEIEALKFSFPIAASKTIAQGASLEIIKQAGQAWCSNCKKDFALDTLFTPCVFCGLYEYDIICGKAFKLIKMEAG